jgi:hypothetical protein
VAFFLPAGAKCKMLILFAAYQYVRHQRREIHNKIKQIKTLTHLQAPHLLAASNRRELNPD